MKINMIFQTPLKLHFKKIGLFFALPLFVSAVLPVFADQDRYSSEWIDLSTMDEKEILSIFNRNLNEIVPILTDKEPGRQQVTLLEKQIRQEINEQNQNWQQEFEKTFNQVSRTYSKKLSLEALINFFGEDIKRLKDRITDYDNRILQQERIIEKSEEMRQTLLDSITKKLAEIPFYVTVYGSVIASTNKSPKEVEKLIQSLITPQAIEYVNGTQIKTEVEVAQGLLVKERITMTMKGLVKYDKISNRPNVMAISGKENQISILALLAVYPWRNPDNLENPSIPKKAVLRQVDISALEESTLSKLNQYPSFFIKDAMNFVQESKSKNLSYQSQLRSFINQITERIKHQEQIITLAQNALKHFTEEKHFHLKQLCQRENDLTRSYSELEQAKQAFKKTNHLYKEFLASKKVYQMLMDLTLDDYEFGAQKLYEQLSKKTYLRFKTNIKEEFISWVSIIDNGQLSRFETNKDKINAQLLKAKIVYTYVRNNPQEGRPTRGVLFVFQSKFVLDSLPDYGFAKSGPQSTNLIKEDKTLRSEPLKDCSVLPEISIPRFSTSTTTNWSIHGQWHNSAGKNPFSPENPAFSFSVSKESELNINLESEIDGYIYILSPVGETIISENNPRFKAKLKKGNYLISASTDTPNQKGKFSLTVSGELMALKGGLIPLSFPEILKKEWSVQAQWLNSAGRSPFSSENPAFSFSIFKDSELDIRLESEVDEYTYILNSLGEIVVSKDSPRFKVKLKKGNYFISASTYYPNEKGEFSLTISGDLVTLDKALMPLPDLLKKELSVQGQWTNSAGQNPFSPENPTFAFSLFKDSELSIKLESDIDEYTYILNPLGEIIVSKDSPSFKTKLKKGNYLISASTYDPNQKGDFSLTISGDLVTLDKALIPLPDLLRKEWSVQGQWTNSAGRNPFSPKNPTFSFSLFKDSELNVKLESEVDEYTYILNSLGEIIVSEESSSFKTKLLKKVNYLISASTYSPNQKGEFTLTILGDIIALNKALPPLSFQETTIVPPYPGHGWYRHPDKYFKYEFTAYEDGQVNIITHSKNSYFYLLNKEGYLIDYFYQFASVSLTKGDYTIIPYDTTSSYSNRYKEDNREQTNLTLSGKVSPLKKVDKNVTFHFQKEIQWDKAVRMSLYARENQHFSFELAKEQTMGIEFTAGNFAILKPNGQLVERGSTWSGTEQDRFFTTQLQKGKYILAVAPYEASGKGTIRIIGEISHFLPMELTSHEQVFHLKTNVSNGITNPDEIVSFEFYVISEGIVGFSLNAFSNKDELLYLLNSENKIETVFEGHYGGINNSIKLKKGKYTLIATVANETINEKLHLGIFGEVKNLEKNQSFGAVKLFSWWKESAGRNPLDPKYPVFTLRSLTDSNVIIDLLSEEDDYLYLLDSDNKVIQKVDSGQISVQLQEGEFYRIVPATYSKGKNGHFTLFVFGQDIARLELLEPIQISGSWENSPGRKPLSSKYTAYSFESLTNDNVIIDLHSEVDDYLYLLDSDNKVIQKIDTGAIYVQLQKGKTYTIVPATYSKGQSGDFALFIFGNDINQNIKLKVSSSVQGQWINSAGKNPFSPDNPAFSFSLLKEAELNFKLESTVDGYIYILNPLGEIIAESEIIGESENEESIIIGSEDGREIVIPEVVAINDLATNDRSNFKTKLKKGNYLVSVSTSSPNKKGNFSLSISGDEPIVLEKALIPFFQENTIVPPYPGNGWREHPNKNFKYEFTLYDNGQVNIVTNHKTPYFYLVNQDGYLVEKYHRFASVSLTKGNYTIIPYDTTYSDAEKYTEDNRGETKLIISGNVSPLRKVDKNVIFHFQKEIQWNKAIRRSFYARDNLHFSFELTKEQLIGVEFQAGHFAILKYDGQFVTSGANWTGNEQDRFITANLRKGKYILAIAPHKKSGEGNIRIIGNISHFRPINYWGVKEQIFRLNTQYSPFSTPIAPPAIRVREQIFRLKTQDTHKITNPGHIAFFKFETTNDGIVGFSLNAFSASKDEILYILKDNQVKRVFEGHYGGINNSIKLNKGKYTLIATSANKTLNEKVHLGIFGKIKNLERHQSLDAIKLSYSWKNSPGRNPLGSYPGALTFKSLKNSHLIIDLLSEEDDYLYFLDSDNNIIQEKDSGQIYAQLEKGETYRIVPATYSEGKTGDFTLFVFGQDIDRLELLEPTQISGTWENSPGREPLSPKYTVYPFESLTNDNVIIDLHSEVDDYLYLLYSDNKVIQKVDSGPIYAQLQKGKIYRIVPATYYKNKTGHFTLSVFGQIKPLVHLTIRSNVYGDQAWIDGRRYGSTPLDVDLQPGTHHIRVTRDGYSEWSKKIRLEIGQSLTVWGQLNRQGSRLAPPFQE